MSQTSGNTRIFIGGLESGITVEQVESEFSRFGSIAQTPWLGKSGTFGFVIYEDQDAAEEAVKAMNGQAVFGETALRVEMAQPKPQGYRRPRYDNPHFDSIYRRGGRSYGSAPYSRSSYGNYERGAGNGGGGPPRDSYSNHHHQHSSSRSGGNGGGYEGGGGRRYYDYRDGGDRLERRDDGSTERIDRREPDGGHRYPPREYSRSSHYESRPPREHRS